ncbi:lytic exoenzyme target recognition domain-containing protein [Leuconostoc sp.]
MSRDKLNADIVNGIGDNIAPVVAPRPQPVSNTSAIQAFKNAGNNFTAYNGFRADEIKQVNGIWQAVNYDLAGGRDFSWTNNGIPLDIVDNVTRGNQAATKVDDTLKFNGNYNHGTIDDYDTSSNAVGIKYGHYGEIWFNADAFLKL